MTSADRRACRRAAPAPLTWDELVTVALVGTERRPLPPAAAPDGTG